MDYDKRWGSHRLRLTKADIKKHAELLLKLLKLSYGIDVESATSTMRRKYRGMAAAQKRPNQLQSFAEGEHQWEACPTLCNS